MPRDIGYPLGFGSTVIYTPNQTEQLSSDLNVLVNANESAVTTGNSVTGSGVAVYQDILDLIATPIFSGASDQEVIGYTANSGVSQEVVNWLYGAIGINTDTTFGAAIIRGYTAEQIALRYGAAAPSLTAIANSLNLASNLIAQNTARFIINQGGEIPDILTLGAFDSGAAASTLFGGDYAGWAGAVFFP